LGVCGLLATAGCSGGGGSAAPAPTAAPSATPAAHDLASYQLFMMGSADGDPAGSQLYGVHLNPVSLDRLTTDTRIRSFAADADHLVVAFADGQVDKLAQVTSAGDLTPIPGLGQPDGTYPMLRDGVLSYGDADGDAATGSHRYYAWNLAGQRKTLLFSSTFDEHPKPAADGRFVLTEARPDGSAVLVVRDGKAEVRRVPLKVGVGAVRVGRDYAAATTLGASSAAAAALPDGLLLVNLATGKTTAVPGLMVLCWSPDGTRLLTVRIGATNDTQLVLLDPTQPEAPQQVLQTLPLPVFEGVWVRGELPS
jgi:hypothetical protein